MNIGVLSNLLKKEENLNPIVNFIVKVIDTKYLPDRLIKFILPWVLKKALQVGSKVIPEDILDMAVQYVGEEVSEEGVISSEQASEIASFINTRVDVPWVPEFIEQRIFLALVYLISYAADSGLDLIAAADSDEVKEKVQTVVS